MTENRKGFFIISFHCCQILIVLYKSTFLDFKTHFPYTRKQAAYPLSYLERGHKFWVDVARVDNAYGDRNLVCACPPMEDYV